MVNAWTSTRYFHIVELSTIQDINPAHFNIQSMQVLLFM